MPRIVTIVTEVDPQHQRVTRKLRFLGLQDPKVSSYIYTLKQLRLINFDTLRWFPTLTPQSPLQVVEQGERGLEAFDPSDLSPSWKPLPAESCTLNPIHDLTLHCFNAST